MIPTFLLLIDQCLGKHRYLLRQLLPAAAIWTITFLTTLHLLSHTH